jgi:hypothetical protein
MLASSTTAKPGKRVQSGARERAGNRYDGEYGETADFEFSSEQAPKAVKGR